MSPNKTHSTHLHHTHTHTHHSTGPAQPKEQFLATNKHVGMSITGHKSNKTKLAQLVEDKHFCYNKKKHVHVAVSVTGHKTTTRQLPLLSPAAKLQ